MRKAIIAGVLTALALGTAVATAPVRAQPGPSACFFVTQWDGGWKAPDDHTIFIRVSGSKIFRLDMASDCPALSSPGASLITRNNTASICRAIDWDLKVATFPGIATPCIVKGMTLLTPAQVAAIPKAVLP